MNGPDGPDDSGSDGGADDAPNGSITMTLEQYNGELAKARRNGERRASNRESRSGREAPDQGINPAMLDQLAERLAERLGGGRAAPTHPPPAAAPSAPVKVDNPTLIGGGYIDLYGGITPEQFAAYTPQQIRDIHERNVSLARTQSGAPPVPQPRKK
jgi:hypothetical protein